MSVMIEPFFDVGTTRTCDKCKRHREAKSPFLKYWGEGRSRILLVIDEPTEGDDSKGKILSGTSKDLLSDMFRAAGASLEKDFWITSAIKCWGSKQPTSSVCTKCKDKLDKEIQELNPKGIFLFGSSAIKTLLGEDMDKSSDVIMAGLKIPYKTMYIYPMQSVSFLVKKQKDKNFIAYFKRTLKEDLVHNDVSQEPLPELNPLDFVKPLTKFDDVKKFLLRILDEEKAFSIDYETTGLNPYVKGHKITTVGICMEGDYAYSFPYMYQHHWTAKQFTEIEELLKEVLLSPNFKIAHNSQFEIKWSDKIIGVRPKIDWCSMTMQHLVDTRKEGHGLKYQAFVRWGVKGYDASSKKYIEAVDGTPFNRMDEMPLGEQLYYVGGDAFLTMKLFLEQEQELSYNEKGAKFFNLGLQTLSEITDNGIWADTEWYNQQEKDLSKEIKELEEELNESQEVAKHMNNNHLSHWDYTSPDQVSDLLINTLGLTTDNKTAGGKVSCDEKTLSRMKHWIPEHILKIRKLLKLRDTYLAQFMREIVEDKLHPEFTLHIARSLRSSSRSPKENWAIQTV
jgi:uracil-DNA glycosylase family 4